MYQAIISYTVNENSQDYSSHLMVLYPASGSREVGRYCHLSLSEGMVSNVTVQVTVQRDSMGFQVFKYLDVIFCRRPYLKCVQSLLVACLHIALFFPLLVFCFCFVLLVLLGNCAFAGSLLGFVCISLAPPQQQET